MATYADGTTEAMIGDVVECIHGDDLCGLIYGWSYVATPATEDQVFLKGRDNEVWKSSRFKLISRAPSPAKAEPLVKWPEETMYKSLERGEYFVYLDDPQVPCVSLGGGQHIQLVKTPKWPQWTLLTCVVESMVPVRRIKRVGVEQFEVI